MKTKPILFGAAGLALLLLFAACSASDSPSTVAKKFYETVRKNDSKAMGKYATAETVAAITMFGEKMQGMVEANGNIKSTTETINGDTAVVTVAFANGEEAKIDLIKVDGNWKVTIKK